MPPDLKSSNVDLVLSGSVSSRLICSGTVHSPQFDQPVNPSVPIGSPCLSLVAGSQTDRCNGMQQSWSAPAAEGPAACNNDLRLSANALLHPAVWAAKLFLHGIRDAWAIGDSNLLFDELAVQLVTSRFFSYISLHMSHALFVSRHLQLQ